MALPAPGRPEALAVLLVEGSPIVRQSLARHVESRGHTVIGTADPGEAWARLGDHGIDVVLADWPTAAGPVMELVRRIRAREAAGTPYTAVWLLASATARSAAPAALAAGADGWLARPIDDADADAALLAAGRIVRLERRLADREQLVRRQEEVLREEVRRDALTRLGNRVRLDEDLRRYRGRALRYGHRVGAVMLAIDGFRRYNDALGLAAGDELLRRVSKAVRESLRDGDAAYRFSGERILLLLPEQTEDGAAVVAERCRAAVTGLRVRHPRSDTADDVTISAGVAQLRGSGREAIDEWLRRAEQALEAARAAGGNQVARGDNTLVPGPDATVTG